MIGPRRFLGGRTAEDFLANYWQKCPLLIRQGVVEYRSPIDAQALLGLACEAEIESRLVELCSNTWRLTPGPLDEDGLSRLGDRDWTVLVSDLEEHIPTTQALLAELDFLPSWRVDDIMASYAVVGGSVGPHFDSYDVFLVQVEGKRRWQISENFDGASLRTDTDLSILSEFHAEQEWELEPGDILYLPPRVAHYGVATSPCMTFSLGCRAPSSSELLIQVASDFVEQASSRQVYADRELVMPQHRHKLGADAIGRARTALLPAFSPTDEQLTRSFAKLVTRPKALFASEFDADELSDAEVDEALATNGLLRRRKGSRWLYAPLRGRVYLYVNEREFDCGVDESFAEQLCRQPAPEAPVWRAWMQNEVRKAVLRDLVRWGLYVPQEEAFDSGQ